jgi:hypothetical protein
VEQPALLYRRLPHADPGVLLGDGRHDAAHGAVDRIESAASGGDREVGAALREGREHRVQLVSGLAEVELVKAVLSSTSEIRELVRRARRQILWAVVL